MTRAVAASRRPSALARRLRHRFSRADLLERALTHSSGAPVARGRPVAAETYERLEFLGDRVLGLVLADLLYHRFPEESEGELARRHAKLAWRESLVEVAARLDLGLYVRMSEGESHAGSRRNAAILADCCEAVIGALYLDGGMKAARGFIERAWGPLIEADQAPPRDPKTTLQEWVQARGRRLPHYRVVERAGPSHAPEFTVELTISGEKPERARGRSKREAEQAAAASLLARLAGGDGRTAHDDA